MEIKFKIETLGYIVAEFLLKNKKTKIGHSSFYGDKFQELLNKFFFIYEIFEHKDENYLPYSDTVLWEDDFVNYQWCISLSSLESSSIKIEVYESSPSNINHRIKLVGEEIKVEDLFNCIYLSLDEIFVNFGFVGYKKNWEVGNFPAYEYIVLKAAKEKLRLKSTNVLEEEKWKQKTIIEDELNVINKTQ